MDRPSNYENRHPRDYIRNIDDDYVPCHTCGLFIIEGESISYDQVLFHTSCFNRYEHYYGLDKPID